MTLKDYVLFRDEKGLERALHHGADVEENDREGNTPLHHAASLGHVGMIRVLLDHGADVRAIGAHNQSVLHMRFDDHDLRAMELLLDAGADPNMEGPYCRSPLHHACSQRLPVGFAELLLARGAVVDQVCRVGETALMTAVRQEQLEHIRVLLDAGANEELVANDGYSAITLAPAILSGEDFAQMSTWLLQRRDRLQEHETMSTLSL